MSHLDTILPVEPSLAAYVTGALEADPPEAHREMGRLHILDTLASVVACRDLEPATLARDYAIAMSGDAINNAVTILGTDQRASLTDAAFASAMTAHGAEINDFIPSAFVQPGPAVVSVAFAIAERRGATGAELLRAIMAGYEIAGRMPKALGIDNLRRAGLANHGIGPIFGAATAAAILLRLPRVRVGDVWTYCAQQASGSWQWLLDVEHIEKSFVFAGLGARAGLHAALMAHAGFRGVRGALDQPGGWMRSGLFTGGDANRNYLIEQLGERSELPLTAYKRYPVGGPTQPAVEGLLSLLPVLGETPVQSVQIEMPGRWQAFRDAAMPALNLRYLSAIILLDKQLDFVSAQSLERLAQDNAARALMDRVEIRHDPAQEIPPPAPRPESARVTVQLSDGRVETTFVPHVLGYPTHPMSKLDVEAKALELMVPSLGAARAQAVVDAVDGLETAAGCRPLIQLIAR